MKPRRNWVPGHLRKLAKQIGLDDLVERSLEPGDVFDDAEATRCVRFFPKYLVHVEGDRAGQPFDLDPWEELLVWALFGWRRADGTRKFRDVFVEIARKNGKSSFGAGLTLLLLFADREAGAQIYGAAWDKDQAGIIYRIASLMVRKSPALSARAQLVDSSKRILEVDPDTREPTGSFYAAIPGEEKGQTGYNAHGVVFDELHEQEDRELHDVLQTSQIARSQPLFIRFTTAEADPNSLCAEQARRARQILEGKLPAPPDYLAIVFALDPAKHDWRDERTWILANPGLATNIVKVDFLRKQVRDAIENPGLQNNVLRFHFNIRTTQVTRWMDMAAWDKSAGIVDPAALKKREAYLAIDLANKIDIAAAVLVFPPADRGEGAYEVLAKFWVPEEALLERARRDRVPYAVWRDQGWIEPTEGNVIHYGAIKKWILEDAAKRFDIREIAYDPWGATQLAQELEADGFTVVEMRQGFKTMSEPTKELLRLVKSRRLVHGGNPVLRWMADNLVVKTDPAGNVKPDREKAKEKIDGMVALVMGLGRAMLPRKEVPRWRVA